MKKQMLLVSLAASSCCISCVGDQLDEINSNIRKGTEQLSEKLTPPAVSTERPQWEFKCFLSNRDDIYLGAGSADAASKRLETILNDLGKEGYHSPAQVLNDGMNARYVCLQRLR